MHTTACKPRRFATAFLIVHLPALCIHCIPAAAALVAGGQGSTGQCSVNSTTIAAENPTLLPRIALGFTTAKRPLLFKRTYLSFMLRCLDCDALITDWYGVDDGSSQEEKAAMQELAPRITWLNKTSDESGHVGSINAMLRVAAEYAYFVWMEDDWFFVRDEHLITRSLQVMKTDPQIGQVLFNANYYDTDAQAEKDLVAGGDRRSVDGIDYIVHRYCGASGSREHAACFSDLQPGQLAHFHWPHFSLRPGVWNMAEMAKLGPVEEGVQFEMLHGHKYVAQGLVTAFLPDIHAVHLAPTAAYIVERPHIAEETYAKHGISVDHGRVQSAYDLRGTFR